MTNFNRCAGTSGTGYVEVRVGVLAGAHIVIAHVEACCAHTYVRVSCDWTAAESYAALGFRMQRLVSY